MEAKIKNEVTQLNIGVNFRSQITSSSCLNCINQMTGLQLGDEVQIYPHTVNAYISPSNEVKTVTVRKLKNQRAYGNFITLPLKSLDLNPEQLALIAEINLTSVHCDSCLTFVKQSCCSDVLERFTGLKGGSRVKFYPYTLEVYIEEVDGIFSVIPLITIAVRAVKNHQAYGDFSVVNIFDLGLNWDQKAKLQQIIGDSLSKFATEESTSNKGAKFLLKKLRNEVNFLSEDILMSLEEEVVTFSDEEAVLAYPYRQ